MTRRVALVVAFLALARPAAAATSLTLEGYGGLQSLQASREGIANAILGRQGTWLVGGDALFDLGGFGLGIGADKTLQSFGPEPWSVFVNGGLLFDLLPSLRIEALGEVGRRGFNSLGDFSFKDSNPAFHTYLGLRPGVSVRLLPTPLRIGVSALIRWALRNGDFGGPDYGVIGRVGFEFGG